VLYHFPHNFDYVAGIFFAAFCNEHYNENKAGASTKGKRVELKWKA